MPEEGSFKKFKNHNRSIRVPFIVYADFECFVEPIGERKLDYEKSFTNQYQKHIPCGFCYHIKCFDDNLFSQEPVIYRKKGCEDVSQIFVDMLEKDIKKIHEKFDFSKKIIMTKEDWNDFPASEKCWICGDLFEDVGEAKVRDHCHFTGKYRGAAHKICNLKFQKPKTTPVIFHNLSGYDSHLFIKALGKSEGNLKCIPNNEEKYISFSKEIVVDSFLKEGKEVTITNEIRFIDSFKFMKLSLSDLVENLTKSGIDKLKETGKIFEEIELLSRKGVYPYD